MKLVLENNICNDVEFTLDDVREALINHYLKKAEENEDLRTEALPHASCGVVAHYDDYSGMSPHGIWHDTPLSVHLRWVDPQKALEMSQKVRNQKLSE